MRCIALATCCIHLDLVAQSEVFIECVDAYQLSCDKLVICLYCNQEVLNTNHRMVHMCISATNNSHLTCLLQNGKTE